MENTSENSSSLLTEQQPPDDNDVFMPNQPVQENVQPVIPYLEYVTTITRWLQSTVSFEPITQDEYFIYSLTCSFILRDFIRAHYTDIVTSESSSSPTPNAIRIQIGHRELKFGDEVESIKYAWLLFNEDAIIDPFEYARVRALKLPHQLIGKYLYRTRKSGKKKGMNRFLDDALTFGQYMKSVEDKNNARWTQTLSKCESIYTNAFVRRRTSSFVGETTTASVIVVGHVAVMIKAPALHEHITLRQKINDVFHYTRLIHPKPNGKNKGNRECSSHVILFGFLRDVLSYRFPFTFVFAHGNKLALDTTDRKNTILLEVCGGGRCATFDVKQLFDSHGEKGLVEPDDLQKKYVL